MQAELQPVIPSACYWGSGEKEYGIIIRGVCSIGDARQG